MEKRTSGFVIQKNTIIYVTSGRYRGNHTYLRYLSTRMNVKGQIVVVRKL